MNIVQRWINKTATTAWIASMVVLLSGCIAENLEDCPQPFELTVRAVDISNKDITSDGDVENVILFTFDETGKRIDKILLTAEEIKSRKPIHIEQYGPKALTFVAWGNVTPAEATRLESVQRIEDVQMPLLRTDGFGQYPTDLFSGRLDRQQQYGVLKLGEPATIDIYRRTCQVNVTVLGYEQWLESHGYKRQAFDPTDYASARILFGKSLDKYSIVDTYNGDPTTYRLTGSLDSSTGDYHIAPFRVYPPIDD
ncbi:FimB/Mfa2 family fimbrial subunit, partial [uncultured Porphyromonas sp.]|uniref:FimB/Mfa2 family fimbrial subunit n=1 Tax=uncultured Porphyromonas sp. TaxID=159274 RepID=UPI0026336D1E